MRPVGLEIEEVVQHVGARGGQAEGDERDAGGGEQRRVEAPVVHHDRNEYQEILDPLAHPKRSWKGVDAERHPAYSRAQRTSVSVPGTPKTPSLVRRKLSSGSQVRPSPWRSRPVTSQPVPRG